MNKTLSILRLLERKKKVINNSVNYLVYLHAYNTFVNSLLRLIYRKLISHYVSTISISFYMWLVNASGKRGDFSGPREGQSKA